MLVGLTLLLAGLAAAPSARADGDPASDVLASQPLFLPQDAGLSARSEAELAAVLTAARRARYVVHVAIIASSADLGSVTALWRRPAAYARFLDQELAQVAPGPLLVVMPNGYGVAGTGRHGPAIDAAVSHLPRPGAGPSLGRAAMDAIEAILRAGGHRVRVGAIAVRGPGSRGDGLVLGGWIAGAIAIMVCWGLSLRARPWVRSGAQAAG